MEQTKLEKTLSNMIGFRLKGEELKVLVSLAKKENISVHEYAKQKLIKHLRGENEGGNLEEYIDKRFDNVEKMLRIVGLDLFFAVQKLLSHVTDSDIKEWLADNMKALEWNVKES